MLGPCAMSHIVLHSQDYYYVTCYVYHTFPRLRLVYLMLDQLDAVSVFSFINFHPHPGSCGVGTVHRYNG